MKGKIVGRPSFFGLEDDEEIPPKLLKKVYGEIEADELVNCVTADWGAIIENSEAFIEISSQIYNYLKRYYSAEVKWVNQSNKYILKKK